ncbi:hypothetical protein CPB86DRAFT_844321 [Serendipita vermifera]|nr:hypothetical protein CPB86DRAFT_844321 [Serendipita vermifera]
MTIKKRRDRTTLLPQSLREEIEKLDSQSSGYSKHKQLSRRDKRNQKKLEKKAHRAAYFAHQKGTLTPSTSTTEDVPPSVHVKPVKRPQEKVKERSEVDVHAPPAKRQKVDHQTSKQQVDSTGSKYAKESKASKEKTTSKTTRGTGTKSKKPNLELLQQPRTQVEMDEDKEIAWLEHQLGLNKKNSKNGLKKMLEEDGLDDLLDGIEEDLFKLDEDEEMDDMDNVEMDEEDSDNSEETEEDEEDTGSQPNEERNTAGEESMEDVESKGDSTEPSSSDNSDEEMDHDTHQAVSAIPSVSTGSKYVPPHLRASASKADQQDAQLLRQLKGIVNRLSEQNMGVLLTQLEDTYRENPRNKVTTTLTSLTIDSISSDVSLLDNHITLYATLVAAMYRAIGIEFAALFVQDIIKTFESAYENGRVQVHETQNEVVGKDSLNLLVCISELYNLQVVSCKLIYGIVRMLIREGMGELEVELLLKILRICGRQLRQDDPLALKDIVQLVSEQMENRKNELSSRTRFMVETLNNLKNNKVKKADASGVETIERMKKFLSGLSKRYPGPAFSLGAKTLHSYIDNRIRIAGRDPLQVTLEDLHSADTKGKWWLVGSGWAGNPLVDAQQNNKDQSNDKVEATQMENKRLLELARAQGMNTDVRRSIFVVLLSSEDYYDACDRLGQLGLTEQQQREIIRVILNCCGKEKTYNPYYALVGHRLCEQAHSHKITAQFALWDFLRELGEDEVGGMEVLKNHASKDGALGNSVSKERTRNLAKLYAWWIAKGAVSIALLKPIDFAKIKPQTQEFLDAMLIDLFVNTQTPIPILSSSALSNIWGQKKYEKRPLEEVVMKGVKHGSLTRGLIFYLSDLEKRRLRSVSNEQGNFIKWAISVSKSALETGLTLAPPDGLDEVTY